MRQSAGPLQSCGSPLLNRHRWVRNVGFVSGSERKRILVWGASAILVAALGAKWILASATGASGSRDRGVAVRRNPSSSGAGLQGAGRSVYVQISGRVRHPGVYSVPLGTRVFEAIRAAGGVARGGDANAVALAARVTDGGRIEIPSLAPANPQTARAAGANPTRSATSPRSDSASPGNGPLSLATATVEQLDGLDGIGPALARRIVAWRSEHGGFASVADLDRVPGIGPAKLAALRAAVSP